jgi:predicted ester cyclase
MSNSDTLRRVFSLADDGDFATIRELLSPEFRATVPGSPAMSADEWLGMFALLPGAFPHARHAIEETLETEDRVVLRGVFTGTHSGDFMGVPATGKVITVPFTNVDRFVDGKLVEHTVDFSGMMLQLGAAVSEQNKAVVRRFITEVLQAGRLDLVDEVLAPTYVNRTMGIDLPAFKGMLAALTDALPVRRFDIEELIAEANAVVARFSWEAHDRNGETISARGLTYYRLTDGKIAEDEPITTPDLAQALAPLMAPTSA